MKMQLTLEDFQILIYLNYDPSMSLKELAANTRIPYYRIGKRIEQLRAWNVLRPPAIEYRPESLGLEAWNVIMQAPTISALEVLERACDLHPYTTYRGRIYKDAVSLFQRYYIPEGSGELLKEWINELEALTNARVEAIDVSSGITCNNYPQIDQWLLNERRWKFDWHDWKKELILKSADPLPFTVQHENYLSYIDKMHLNILNLLHHDANMSVRTLSQQLNASKSNVGRKLQFLKNHIISAVRTQYDRKIFDLTNSKLIWIPRSSDKELAAARLYQQLRQNPLPFRFSVQFGRDYLWIWFIFPPYHEAEMVYCLFDLFSEIHVYTMDIIGESGTMYPIYPENFDQKRKKWKTSRKWMIDDPLKDLRLSLDKQN